MTTLLHTEVNKIYKYIMDKLTDKNYYWCKCCNVILRKSNKWRHENSERHSLAVELIDKKGHDNRNIENIIKSIQSQQSPRGTESSSNSITTDSGSNTSIFRCGNAPPTHAIQPIYVPRYNLHYDPEQDHIDRFAINSNFYSTNRT